VGTGCLQWSDAGYGEVQSRDAADTSRVGTPLQHGAGFSYAPPGDTAVRFSAAWAEAFDGLYTDFALSVPQALVRTALDAGALDRHPPNERPVRGGTGRHLPLDPQSRPGTLRLAVADALVGSITEVLADAAVVTLIRESVATKLEAIVALHSDVS
jgi:hypothetical protein